MKIFFSFLILLLFTKLYGQSQGPYAGSSSSNTVISGSTSTTKNGNNAYASDNSYATNTTNLSSTGNYSDYLVISGFGFSIPAGSTINGIEVVVERSDPNGKIKDNIIAVVKSGTIGSTNKASSSFWPTTDGTITYGNNADLWGTAWTETDINSSAFGVALSWKRNGGGASTAFANIDLVTVAVYYTAPLPIELVRFTALPVHKYVKLEWETASEINTEQFIVERSSDLETTEAVAALPA